MSFSSSEIIAGITIGAAAASRVSRMVSEAADIIT